MPQFSPSFQTQRLTVDDVFEKIGNFGYQQKKIFVALGFVNFYSAFHSLQLVFVGARPQFHCAWSNSTAATTIVDPCLNADGVLCSNFVYTSNFTSIATEWQLLCGKEYKVSMTQSLYMGGLMVGAIMFGILSDHFGRLLTLLASVAIIVTMATASSIAPTWPLYTAARFLCGIGTGGCAVVMFVLLTELIGTSARTSAGILVQLFFTFGIMALSGLAYAMPVWRHLAFFTATIGILLISLYWLVPESPRWLLAKGRVRQAEAVLKYIAEKNGKHYPDKVQLESASESDVGKCGQGSLLDLWRIHKLRKYTLVQVWSWFVNGSTYYGLSMVAGDLTSSLYMSNLLLGLVEVPGTLAAMWLIQWSGRRKPLCGFMIVGGVACLAILTIPKSLPAAAMVRVGLALVGKMGISASFAIIYIHSTEMNPTCVRNSAMGLCAIAARIGGMLSPFMADLGSYHPSLQFLVFGLLSFSSGLFNLLLPETLNQPLPETMQDFLKLGKNSGRRERGGEKVERGLDDQQVALMTEMIEQVEQENTDA